MSWHGGRWTPSGAPGETMKTFQQIEPRSPISSLAYTISEPGSCYVTANLIPAGSGIILESNSYGIYLCGQCQGNRVRKHTRGIYLDQADGNWIESNCVDGEEGVLDSTRDA